MGDGLYGRNKIQPRGIQRGSGIGGFFGALFASLVAHIGWSIPAWGLLAAHYLLHWPMWVFWVALGLWLGYVMFVTVVVVWGNAMGNLPDESRPNKNPYSVQSDSEVFKQK